MRTFQFSHLISVHQLIRKLHRRESLYFASLSGNTCCTVSAEQTRAERIATSAKARSRGSSREDVERSRQPLPAGAIDPAPTPPRWVCVRSLAFSARTHAGSRGNWHLHARKQSRRAPTHTTARCRGRRGHARHGRLPHEGLAKCARGCRRWACAQSASRGLQGREERVCAHPG